MAQAARVNTKVGRRKHGSLTRSHVDHTHGLAHVQIFWYIRNILRNISLRGVLVLTILFQIVIIFFLIKVSSVHSCHTVCTPNMEGLIPCRFNSVQSAATVLQDSPCCCTPSSTLLYVALPPALTLPYTDQYTHQHVSPLPIPGQILVKECDCLWMDDTAVCWSDQ